MKRNLLLISIVTMFSLMIFSVSAQEQNPPATSESATQQASEEATQETTEQTGEETLQQGSEQTSGEATESEILETETSEAATGDTTEVIFEPVIMTEQDGTVIAPNEINPIALSYNVASDSAEFLVDVEEAFMTWQDVSVGAIETTRSEAATIIFDVADEALMGPDVISLKVLENNLGEIDASSTPERITKILVAESVRDGAPNLYKSALLHEVGLLVGLPLQESGVMQRGLSEDVAPSVSVVEARALTTQASTAKEDINRDGNVDFYDLVELAKNFIEFPQNYNADITADGSVNDDDVKQLKEAYEFSDPVDPVGSEDSEAAEQTPDGNEDEVPETVGEVVDEVVSEADSEPSEEAMAEIVRSAQEQASQNAKENEADSTEENLPQNTDENDGATEGTSEGQ